MSEEGRVLVWFSCGAASAVAAHLALQKYPHAEVIYNDVMATEHPDNERFLRNIESWIGVQVMRLKSDKYATVDDVFMQRKYMAGIKGAPCTVEMKRIPRYRYQQPTDLHIFGLTADEPNRIRDYEAANPEMELEWVLQGAGITKKRCYQIIEDAGIKLPTMYSLGFKNNNCLGCVKATSPAYWERTRINFPGVFNRRVEQSRKLNVRLARYKGQRVFLDQLPFVNDDQTPEEDIDCGPICITEKLVQIGEQP
jgi:hypothetical protein